MMERPPPRAVPLEPPPPPHASPPHASPGLLRRRYSVPETIMRKYNLAQQHSDSEESAAAAAAAARWSAASACPSGAQADSPHGFLRRDRELMRKSALLRRMGARPCPAAACRCCEETRATRSLDGSHSELSSRRSPAPWTSPKRQRLEPSLAAGDHSDSTFQSHYVHPSAGAVLDFSSCADTTDVFTDTGSSRRHSERAPASTELERSLPESAARGDCFRPESDTLSASVSTAKETSDSPLQDSLSSNGRIVGRVSERSAGVDNEDRNVPSYERPSAALHAPAPLYELLEIVVSESADAAADVREGNAPPPVIALALQNAKDIDIDEYVSNILVESLNSLTDQLETMNASIGGHRRVSIVEKEIKVRLQNAGVNTVVHLSPTSNNQIIFGNEELCNEPRARDHCNNPLSIREERDPGLESDDGLTSSAGSGAPPAPAPPPRVLAFDPPLQRDGVNRAVLQQIQQLFRDELRSLEEGESPPAPPGVSHVEISNVDAYLEAHGVEGALRPVLEIATRADGDLIAGIGTGNYFRDGNEAGTVPRFSAFPHTDSMEVNTSSSSEGEAARSECASLVDSLDDPNSPRVAPACRRGNLARSGLDVLELLPERARDASAESRGEAFFVRIEDDHFERSDRDRIEGSVRVAECMPEKIKQRLYRRHRKRELRVECARRSKVKQLKKELEQRRAEEAAVARRLLERDCMAIVNALIDDVVAKIAQDECMRIRRRNGKLLAARSEENLARRTRRWDLGAFHDGADSKNVRRAGSRHSSNKENRKLERRHIHGKLLARPALANPDPPSRRIYQKSEIHEGEKCIEILEILEYVNGSQSSPETTNSDENHNQNSRCKKSRIPIPVYERIQRTGGEGRMRLTGGDGRRCSPPPTGRMLASMLMQALGDSPPAPAPAPPEPRSRSNSLRFKRVFDIIPEERSSISFESSAEDAELARRASAPEVPAPAPAPVPAPAESSQRGASTRHAGTSPPEEHARVLRSQTTMTSPCSKSAATSPLRPAAPPASPAPPAPPRLVREGIMCALRSPAPAHHRTASLAVE